MKISMAPATDIGFDPKCIVRTTPDVPYQQSWWTYSIDYDYIRSLGGVAGCFHPKARTGGADIGAYEMSGEAHTFSEPGSCVPAGDTACADGLTRCGQDCVELTTSSDSCGSCGVILL